MTEECINTEGSFECESIECDKGLKLNEKTGECDGEMIPRPNLMPVSQILMNAKATLMTVQQRKFVSTRKVASNAI